MPRFLQRPLGGVAGGQQRAVRVEFVRPCQLARARHHDAVVPARAALREHQVVPAVAPVDVGAFDQFVPRKDRAGLPDQGLLPGVVLLEQDPGEGGVSVAGVPLDVEQPAAAVLVVEEGRVEAGGVEEDRLRPRALDRGGGDQVVVDVLVGVPDGAHDAVDQPEPAVVVRQRGRPHSGRVGDSAQVEQVGAVQDVTGRFPVGEIGRAVHGHAREPFEGGGGEEVLRADAQDARIRVESGQYGVADVARCHAVTRIPWLVGYFMPSSLCFGVR